MKKILLAALLSGFSCLAHAVHYDVMLGTSQGAVQAVRSRWIFTVILIWRASCRLIAPVVTSCSRVILMILKVGHGQLMTQLSGLCRNL